MHTLTFQVEYVQGEIVYFRVDQEKGWMVVGHVFSNNQILYQLSNPDLGLYEASAQELTTERSIF